VLEIIQEIVPLMFVIFTTFY